jgi:hypothetical protein
VIAYAILALGATTRTRVLTEVVIYVLDNFFRRERQGEVSTTPTTGECGLSFPLATLSIESCNGSELV